VKQRKVIVFDDDADLARQYLDYVKIAGRAHRLVAKAEAARKKRPKLEHDEMLIMRAAAIQRHNPKLSRRAALLQAIRLKLKEEKAALNALRRVTGKLKGRSLAAFEKNKSYRFEYEIGPDPAWIHGRHHFKMKLGNF
jgi:hypothetical protein